LGEHVGAITLADVRGMVVSSWDNVTAWLAEAGEGSEGNAACTNSSLLLGEICTPVASCGVLISDL